MISVPCSFSAGSHSRWSDQIADHPETMTEMSRSSIVLFDGFVCSGAEGICPEEKCSDAAGQDRQIRQFLFFETVYGG